MVSQVDNVYTCICLLIVNNWNFSLQLSSFKCGNVFFFNLTLRKHAYSNLLKILPPNIDNFQIKNSDIFHISAKNIDCEYSLEPPH